MDKNFSLNDYFSEVYLIHLPSEINREAHMKEEFRRINTRYFLQPGVRPSKEDRKNHTTQLCRNFCSDSMLGIYLAHRQIWEKIVALELPSTVIFEDDVVFTKDIATILPKAIQELPSNWDILHLGCMTCSKHTPFLVHLFTDWKKLFKPNVQPFTEHLVIPNTTLGAEAYALSLEGAKKLLQYLPSATNHVDVMITSILPQLQNYAIYPQVAYQHPSGFKYTSNGTQAPALLNYLLSYIKLQPTNPYNHSTLAYGLSIPIALIPLELPYNIRQPFINGWAILFLLLGFANKHPLLLKIVLLYLLLDYSLYPTHISQHILYMYIACIGWFLRNIVS